MASQEVPDKTARPSLAQRVKAFDPLTLFHRAPPPKTPRTVYVQQDLPEQYYDVKRNGKRKIRRDHVYTVNQVITSKYTVLTFVPKNLFEQFRRVANIFFLAIDILQFFPKFSTISPGLVILPLIAILAITAAKDGYEDVKRHQSDRAVNHSVTQVLDGDDFENPNVTGAKSRTFVPGVPRVVRRPKASASADTNPPSRSIADSNSVNTEVKASAEEDNQHTMRVELPPTTLPADSPTSASENSNTLISSPEHGGPEAFWRDTHWEDVRVGDFVLLKSDEPVPADIVICATSEPENVAFIETKNLDGETNLKSRNAVPELVSLTTPSRIVHETGKHGSKRFRIDAEAPDVNMYRLNAAVVMLDQAGADGGIHPIDIQTVLLRGTVLRNTDWVVGVVLYTGSDTKIVINSGQTPSKRSRVERKMNPMVLFNLAIIAAMAVVCGAIDSVLEQHYFPLMAPWTYNDILGSDNPKINGLITFLNAFITFQNVIPISLYVSIEFVRTAQAAFIYFDGDMMYTKPGMDPTKDGKATLARSWNLADDLGQIEYVFSDKTGTLTQNLMEFRQCSVAGKLYAGSGGIVDPKAASIGHQGALSDQPPSPDQLEEKEPVQKHFRDSQLSLDIQSSSAQSEAVRQFFTALALCHTVLASQTKEGSIAYKAQSPDEAALVQAAADVGYIFLGRDPGTQILNLRTPHTDEVEQYELLNLLDFTSARKRMSVILRCLNPSNGQKSLLLLCKGADNVIFERLSDDDDTALKEQTGHDLDTFASEGLRTLCLAQRYLSDDEYAMWEQDYHHATVQIVNRDEEIERVSSTIEQGLNLLGATAIEDKLQDGVPETIADLKRAGIKVWVATGDKLETAIAIGYSTNLISRDANLVVVKGSSKSAHMQMVEALERFFPQNNSTNNKLRTTFSSASDAERQTDGRISFQRAVTGLSDIVGNDNGKRPGGFVLVVDGAALTQAFADDHGKDLLLRLATQCEAVICCRVSPLQKALVVKLVKDGLNVMTLAIGDGANDVSMIQSADVGVGISGEEGLQAVNSSDYAIAQFRFLKRLLLVHGEWSYARNGNMIINFFYKNIVGVGVLWWFQIYCGWSTTYVFEYTYLLFWNVFWSLAPVIAIGIFDRNIDSDILMALPELYRYGRRQEWFGLVPFALYMMEGVYQSAAVFFFLLYSYDTTSSRTDGWDVYMFEMSTTMVIAAVLVVNAFHGLSTSAWTGWVWFSVFVGPFLVWAYTLVYSALPPNTVATPVYGNDVYLFPSAYFWFGFILTFMIALLPRFLAKAYRVMYHPNDIDILRIARKHAPSQDIENHPLAGGRFNLDGTLKDVSTLHGATGDSIALTPHAEHVRPDTLAHIGSRTDMSTGLQLVPSRGFDFSQEEGGPAIRRIQTDLSQRSLQTGEHHGRRRRAGSRFIPSSLRRSLHKGSRRASTASGPDE